MISNTRTRLTLIVFFTMMVNITLSAYAHPETQTVEITRTEYDGFITEVGIAFDSTLIHILDPNMDIRAFVLFENVKINKNERMDNATLRLRSASTLPFDAGSSVTIYGIKRSNLQDSALDAFNNPGSFITARLTDTSVNVNTSLFYGGATLEIDVFDIVYELKNRFSWDGDGRSGGGGGLHGDMIGFFILGAEGSDVRYFYDYLGDPARAAELIIDWGAERTPPGNVPPAAEFVNMTGEWEIWSYNPWLNFSTFNVTGGDSALISGLNDTYFHVQQMRGHDSVWMQRFFPDAGAGVVNRKFGIEFTALFAGGGGSAWIGHWGISDTSTTWINDWEDGYAFVARVFDLGDDAHRGTAWDIEANALGDSNNWFYSVNHVESNMPYTLWFDIELNLNLGFYNVSTYNDFEMTDLNGTINYAFTDVFPPYTPGAFPYETLVNGWDNIVTTMGYTANYLSDFIDGAEVWVYNPITNQTLPVPDCDKDGDIDEDDAICLIGDVDPDVEDPAPGTIWGEAGILTRFNTRFGFLFVGFIMIFGPLISFSLSRPSGYEFTIGMFIMLIGFAIWIAAGSV